MSRELVWTLRRSPTARGATLGELDLGSGRFCYTLEDPIREQPGLQVAAWKVPGETAIPAGRYKVVITDSVRFQRPLPLLLGVPGFTGVRIHPGNTAADTEGCILLGQAVNGASVARSRAAFDELFTRLKHALRVMDVYLEIQNPPAAPGTLQA